MYIYVCIMIKELRSLKLLGWSVIFVVMVREAMRNLYLSHSMCG